MCAIHILCKTGKVCIRVAQPYFIFDRNDVRKIRTHMCNFIPADLALSLKQVLSFCTIPLLPTLLSGVHIQSNSTSGSTIGPAKQWVVIIKGFVVRVNNSPPPPLCTLHNEPIVGIIYHFFIEIILEINLGVRCPIDALVFQPDIDHIHRKNRQVEPLRPIFSTQLFFNVFLAAPIVPINLATCAVIELCCDWLRDGQINHIGICILVRVLLPSSCAIVWPPFIH